MRWEIGAGIVLGLVGGVVLYRLMPGAPDAPMPAAPAVFATPAPPPPAPPSAPAASAAAPLPPASASTDTQPVAGERVWDLCGIGRVPFTADARAAQGRGQPATLPPHLYEQPLRDARVALVAALRSGDMRRRAAGQLIALAAEPTASAALLPPWLEVLERSNDPIVLGWAWARCQADGTCGPELADRWRAADPGNAAAWLSLAEKDPQRLAAQLNALRAATGFRTNFGHLAGLAQRATPPDLMPYLQSALLSEVLSVDEGLAPDLAGFTALCLSEAPGAPLPPEQRAACARAIELALMRGDSLRVRDLVRRAAQRLGLNTLVERTRRFDPPAAPASAAGESQPLSCTAVRRQQLWVAMLRQRGEVGAAYLRP